MPLSARLVEIAAERGWRSIEETLNMLPGRCFEVRQELPASVEERSRIMQKDEQTKKPLTLVYFIGGVTFSEISAIRHLSEKESLARDFIVATTQLCNGDTMLAEVVEKIVNNLKRSTIKMDAPTK